MCLVSEIWLAKRNSLRAFENQRGTALLPWKLNLEISWTVLVWEKDQSSDFPFNAISRQPRPTSSLAPYDFAHKAILAVNGLQNTRINHLQNKSSTWVSKLVSKTDPVSPFVSIRNQSTLDLGDPHSLLACDLLKTLMATACCSSSTACKKKLGKCQEAIPSPLALWDQVTSAVGSLLWKAFRDFVWIQTPWKEADLLTTLMRIKRTKTCMESWGATSTKEPKAYRTHKPAVLCLFCMATSILSVAARQKKTRAAL